MTQTTAGARWRWLAPVLVVLAVLAVGLPDRLLSRMAFAIERGRTDAHREELASVLAVSHSFRSIAAACTPGVVSIRVRGSAADHDRLMEIADELRDLKKQAETLENRGGEDGLNANDVRELARIREEILRLQLRSERLIERLAEGTGSGIIYDDRGHIITNNHVIEDHSEIEVTLANGREYRAGIVGVDESTDLAVIKVEATDIIPLAFGDSDAMEVGDWVLAVGAPFGLQHTVTHGIVSAKGRHEVVAPNNVIYRDYLQTDASINPGNSGGPLINLKGEVIGVNTAIATHGDGINAGVAFTIPSNMVTRIASQLIETGSVARGWLGVSMYPLTRADNELLGVPDGGVLISRIQVDGPAEQAGLDVEDVITKVGGIEVRDDDELLKAVADFPPGKLVPMEYYREGEKRIAKVTMGRRPPQNEVRRSVMRGAIEIDPLELQLQTLLPSLEISAFGDDARGAVFSTSSLNKPPFDALEARQAYLITAVNSQAVTTAAGVRDLIAAAPAGDELRLQIRSEDGDDITLVVRKP